MLDIPNMLMIGGNSRNAGKTTLACKIIQKLATQHQVIALKVTSIRFGEDDQHGNHSDDDFPGFKITEEKNTESTKDTSLMLQAGAERVFYVRAAEGFASQAINEFLVHYNTNQPIVCESRSLRDEVKPGLFVMMMRIPSVGKKKDVGKYLETADHILYYSENQEDISHTVSKVVFKQKRFILSL